MRWWGLLMLGACYDPAALPAGDAPNLTDGAPTEDGPRPDDGAALGDGTALEDADVGPPCLVTLGPFGDDFDDGLEPPGTALYGTASRVDGGRLRIDLPVSTPGAKAGLYSVDPIDTEGLAFLVKLVDAPDSFRLAAYFGLYSGTGGDEWMGFVLKEEKLYLSLAGTELSSTWDAIEVWWRIRVDPSNVRFDVSADGTAWRQVASFSTPIWRGTAHLELGAESPTGIVVDETVGFDNLNVPPACPP
jgi:hypothetical protein